MTPPDRHTLTERLFFSWVVFVFIVGWTVIITGGFYLLWWLFG